MNGCCGTCKYGHYDKMQGYVCVNDESEYHEKMVKNCRPGIWQVRNNVPI